MSNQSGGSAAQAATRRALATIWEKNLPVLRERLGLLDAAVMAAEAGTLTAEQRQEAGSTAHKLAGSLGMFGYPRGTDLARALEQSFDLGAALDKQELSAKMALLRAELGL